MGSMRQHSLFRTCPSCTPNHRLSRAVSLSIRRAFHGTTQDSYSQLSEWVRTHTPQPPSDLHPASINLSQGAYGMFTDAPVDKGQNLVCVPRQLMMSKHTASGSAACGSIPTMEGVTDWQVLCLHLLCERALGEDSFWCTYIQTLPDQSEHPLLWGPEQLLWLEGSPLLGRLRDRLEQVAEDVETLDLAGANELPVAVQYKEEHKEDLVTESSMKWAAATILSRSFSLDLEDPDQGGGDLEADDEDGQWGEAQERSICLVPWADLLNHSSEAGPESVLTYQPDLGAATLAAHRTYASGEQVFDSYGEQLSPGELLLDYGCVTDASAENDRFEVLASTVVAKPRGARNAKILSALEKMAGGPNLLTLQPEGPDPGSLTWMRAALATDSELIRSGWRVRSTEDSVDDAGRALGRLSEPLSESTEVAVLGALEGYIEGQLQSYPSTLQQDEELLAAGKLPWLKEQAVKAVASEKRSLEGSLESVRWWRQQLREGVPLYELYLEEEGGEDEEEEGVDA